MTSPLSLFSAPILRLQDSLLVDEAKEADSIVLFSYPLLALYFEIALPADMFHLLCDNTQSILD